MAVRELKSGKYRVRCELDLQVDDRESAVRLDKIASSAIEYAKRRYFRGDRPCTSILEAMERFLDQQSVFNENSAQTLSAYRRRLNMFARAFGDRPIDDISRDELHLWIRERLGSRGKKRAHAPGSGVSRDTVNNDLKALRAFCKWSAECGYAPAGIEIMTVPLLRVRGKISGNRFPPRAMVRQNFLRILRRISRESAHVGLVLRAMLLLGARPEALFALVWRDVQLPRAGIGSVRLGPLKGGAEGSVPIRPGSHAEKLFRDARSIFRRHHGRVRAGDPVFCTRRGRSRRRRLGWTTDSYDHQLAAICSRLGIIGFSAYAARHSAVTWLQQQPGVSPAAVQAYARHLRVSTQEAYSHRSGVDGEPAYEAMEGIVGGGSVAPDIREQADMVSALEGIDSAMDCED